jgi:hypothetical protein
VIDLLAGAVPIELAPPDRFQRGAKPVIHEAFVHPLSNVINHVSVRESLNLIFLRR